MLLQKWTVFIVTLFVCGCQTETTNIQVEKVLSLDHFPSGSSLEVFRQNIYLSGDDATKLLVLDSNYNIIDSVTLFEGEDKRIPKDAKADIEASTIVEVDGQPNLLLVGSGSAPVREKLLLLSLDSMRLLQRPANNFISRLREAGLEDINIEGAATAGSTLILANRGNLSNPVNHLVFTNPDLWLNQQSVPITMAVVVLPDQKAFPGISGLAYIEKDDILLFTASTESTSNSLDDGKIGDSYLGWIKDISTKTAAKEIPVNGFINLPKAHKIFLGEKIESVCVGKTDNEEYTIHLVSDNDKGASKLFKVKVKID